MDLHTRSLVALDWDFVIDRLAMHAHTHRGQRAARAPGLMASDLAGVHARYAAVEELWLLEDVEAGRLPVGGVGDVAEHIDRAARGMVLEVTELLGVSATLDALARLRRWLDEREDEVPVLAGLAAPIQVDPELHALLGRAFDDTGALSAQTWPELGVLRARIRQLADQIRSVLESLISARGGVLQDGFVTERAGRFVVPVKASGRPRRGADGPLGQYIVHATSQSGETVFVEPGEVVEKTNQLKEVEAALEREERRILARLSLMVGQSRGPLGQSLDAAAELDLAVARAGLGRQLGGSLPEVHEGGVIHLVRARHPVLALRLAGEVVPNDLAVGRERAGLVLTGPNTGGKTVALKTIGLAALQVRAGIPLAADEGTRMDLFTPVLASVGDAQTVREDLSTFSGHVLELDAMLGAAGPGSLVLLDEVGSGTDPVQGAALARAVLEAFADGGACVVATTHYNELKALCVADARFAVAAVQVEGGQPTYRVVMGQSGRSHALTTAARLGMRADVVARARALMDDESRRLSALVDQAEAEREAAHRARLDAEARVAELKAKQHELERQLEAIEARKQALSREVARGFEARVRAREEEVKGLIAALQTDPNLRLAGRSLKRIREIREELAPEARSPAPPPRPQVREIAVGNSVFVRNLGRQARVLELLGKDRVRIELGGIQSTVKRSELGAALPDPPAAPQSPRGAAKARASKAPALPEMAKARSVRLRTPDTTCDLRGLRADVALERVAEFLDKMAVGGHDAAYVLHGHGTGALKEAVRQWLPTAAHARRWRPASEDEGGDAFTIVEL